MKQLIGPIAQRLEQSTHNALVPGSNPGGPTNTDDIIDAEFTVVYGPSWLERQAQIAFYKYIQNITKNKAPKIIDTAA